MLKPLPNGSQSVSFAVHASQATDPGGLATESEPVLPLGLTVVWIRSSCAELVGTAIISSATEATNTTNAPLPPLMQPGYLYALSRYKSV
jgi:hypothetical protein